VGEYDDFEGMSLSGTSIHSSADSFHEDVLQELGYYDKSEDLSQWSFERRFADDQWKESNLTLLGSRNNFMGPTPGQTAIHDGLPFPEVEYFLKFWPPHVLQRIVEETNRYLSLFILCCQMHYNIFFFLLDKLLV
jgi:hypothetical protein